MPLLVLLTAAGDIAPEIDRQDDVWMDAAKPERVWRVRALKVVDSCGVGWLQGRLNVARKANGTVGDRSVSVPTWLREIPEGGMLSCE